MYNRKLHFHFVGIGGSGMSGLAEVLHNSGFIVSGSDIRDSRLCNRLRDLGVNVQIGHRAENLNPAVSLVVYSSAVASENPEVMEAVRRGLPVVRRAEVLAELMRLKFGVAVAGSHGKTTTTSMIAGVLEHGGLDPTVIIGGQVKSSSDLSSLSQSANSSGENDTGGRVGKGEYLVAETDESDRSFLLLKPTIAVVTNIDNEHMSAYSSVQDLEGAFEQFVDSVPFYGLRVLCIDDPVLRGFNQNSKGRVVSYGISADATYRAEGFTHHRDRTSFKVLGSGKLLGEVALPALGTHLAVNSLAAVAVGLEFGIPMPIIVEALEQFRGVRRRLEVLGEFAGVTVINDYAHHPTEITASLRAIRNGWPEARVIAVFQPHRYSRTLQCFAQFVDAFTVCERLILTDIYSAGELPLEAISTEKLFEAISHPDKTHLDSFDRVKDQLLAECSPGDVIVFMGAGSIGQFANEFPRNLPPSKANGGYLPYSSQVPAR